MSVPVSDRTEIRPEMAEAESADPREIASEQFAHGVMVRMPDGPAGPHALLGCYHPSRQNTNTGKLTPTMMTGVFKKARKLIEA